MGAIYTKDSNRDMLQRLQRAGFNITTCGECGAVRLHKTGIDELNCEDCGLVSDICNFPDLYVVEA
jgi:hypothetical protein